jgi:hypothetical protein
MVDWSAKLCIKLTGLREFLRLAPLKDQCAERTLAAEERHNQGRAKAGRNSGIAQGIAWLNVRIS